MSWSTRESANLFKKPAVSVWGSPGAPALVSSAAECRRRGFDSVAIGRLGVDNQALAYTPFTCRENEELAANRDSPYLQRDDQG